MRISGEGCGNADILELSMSGLNRDDLLETEWLLQMQEGYHREEKLGFSEWHWRAEAADRFLLNASKKFWMTTAILKWNNRPH